MFKVTATVKKIRAQTGDSMREWEYRRLDLNDLPRKSTDIEALNAAGNDNSELVTIIANAIAYLKRRIPPDPAPHKGKPKA